MSIHSSLKSTGTMKRHRSVLSRLERVKFLQEKGSLDLEGSSFLGLPKVKHLKIKVRKEKAAAPAAEAGASPAAAGAPTPSAAPPGGGKTAAKATPAAKTSGAPSKPEAGAPTKKKE